MTKEYHVTDYKRVVAGGRPGGDRPFASLRGTYRLDAGAISAPALGLLCFFFFSSRTLLAEERFL